MDLKYMDRSHVTLERQMALGKDFDECRKDAF
jgi:hypothetical protein